MYCGQQILILDLLNFAIINVKGNSFQIIEFSSDQYANFIYNQLESHVIY